MKTQSSFVGISVVLGFASILQDPDRGRCSWVPERFVGSTALIGLVRLELVDSLFSGTRQLIECNQFELLCCKRSHRGPTLGQPLSTMIL